MIVYCLRKYYSIYIEEESWWELKKSRGKEGHDYEQNMSYLNNETLNQ